MLFGSPGSRSGSGKIPNPDPLSTKKTCNSNFLVIKFSEIQFCLNNFLSLILVLSSIRIPNRTFFFKPDPWIRIWIRKKCTYLFIYLSIYILTTYSPWHTYHYNDDEKWLYMCCFPLTPFPIFHLCSYRFVIEHRES